MLIDKMVLKSFMSIETMGAEWTAMVMGVFAEQDMELEVVVSGEHKVAARAVVCMATGLIICNCERGWWAQRAVTSWEHQSDGDAMTG